jgi:hypothetical protein
MDESSSADGKDQPRRKQRASRSKRGLLIDTDRPRQMTAHTAALIASRRGSLAAYPIQASPDDQTRPGQQAEVVAADGRTAFSLTATRSGLLVERTAVGRLGTLLQQTLLLPNAEEFDRWCDTDPIRFDHPLAHEQLLRRGHELLARSR